MSNTNNLLSALDSLHKDMIRGGAAYIAGGGDPDPDEELTVHDIQLDESELILFSGVPDGVYCTNELIEKSELNNGLLSIVQKLFADVYAAQLEYSNRYNKWMFVLNFRYLTDEQFKAIQDENSDKLIKAVSSTFDPQANKTGGVAETLMSLVGNQNMPSSDVCKYASITKAAKEYLVGFLYYAPTNKKKKWVRGENYDIQHVVQTSYNGQRYSNIVASVYLDAEKVLGMLCATSENRDKYKFTLSPSSTKINNMDGLFEVHRYSKARRRKLSAKYGIQFSNN